MTGSTLPESDAAFQAPHSGHPVHRATASLEQALHSPADASSVTGPFEAPAVRLAPSQIRPADRASDTTRPEASPIGFFELRQDLGDARARCQPPVIDRVDVSVLDASGAQDEDKDDMLDYAAHAQLRGLVNAFHHSQRQASLIVAGSIGAALALTLCGLLIVFSATSSDTPGPAKTPAQDDVSSVSPEIHHATATGPTLEPIQVNTISDGVSEVKFIKAQAGRPLALGPLLPLGVARYVLLRGLPEHDALGWAPHQRRHMDGQGRRYRWVDTHPQRRNPWRPRRRDLSARLRTRTAGAQAADPARRYKSESLRRQPRPPLAKFFSGRVGTACNG